ncbi:MAG: TRAP transporter large permease [Clostridia bacterium]
MGTVILFVTLGITLFIGIPVGFSLVLAVLAMLAVDPIMPVTYVAQTMYSGLDSFTLLSMPFFILAGSIMEQAGISKRLVNFANSLVGNVTGGLGIVTVLACLFFGAISGSAAATVACIGAIMIPQMVKYGYSKYYATGLVAVAGGLGLLIPPSYTMVVYGVTVGESIGDLFIAGIGPGILVAVLLIIVNYVMCKKRGYSGSGQRFNLRNVGKQLWDAKWALLMPVIILGGIYSGIFSATEAAVVSCVYGIIIGLFVYKQLTFKTVWTLYRKNVVFLGGMIFVFAAAKSLGAVFSYLGVSSTVSNFFTGISTNYYVIITIIIGMLFIIGMFLQTTPATVIFAPVMLTVLKSVGMDPIHFGVIMTMAFALGNVTPPVAQNLFVASSMTGISMNKIVKAALPFIGVLIIAMFIIAFVPEISMFLLK